MTDCEWQHMAAAATSRPRSSIWARGCAISQAVVDPDEKPVVYRIPHTPLSRPVQSPRAPWLYTAAMTAAKFKQPSNFQSERVTEHTCSHDQACMHSSKCLQAAFILCRD